jgi:hypothetical protein
MCNRLFETGVSAMIDFNAELESANMRIAEIQKTIDVQVRVLRQLANRGMDKTLAQRMLDVRRYYLRRTMAHAQLIKSRTIAGSRRSEAA